MKFCCMRTSAHHVRTIFSRSCDVVIGNAFGDTVPAHTMACVSGKWLSFLFRLET